MYKTKILFLYILLIFVSIKLSAQIDTSNQLITVDYSSPKTYELAGIDIVGTNYYDKSVLAVLTGLSVGQKIRIPSDDITKAINSLWKQKLFDDVKAKIKLIQDDKLTIEFVLREKPRLSTFSLKGLSKGKAEDLRDELTLRTGQIINENMISTTRREIIKHFVDKGYTDAKAEFESIVDDAAKNTSKLKITIERGPRIKIYDITFTGNKALTAREIRGLFKETKRKRKLFAKSKFIEDDYTEDKQKIIDKYLSMGYRDVQITSDSIWRNGGKGIEIKINIVEGQKYYFRNIKFVGNNKYKDEELNSVLKIKRGDVYDQSNLDSKLNMSQSSLDISTLYMDDGYLFFRVEPIEVLVENDSIDLEIRIYEGAQARVNKVTVKGNTKTSDHVILRELRTKPGQLFSRSDVTRSLRELGQIGYFNPEALNVNPMPNPQTGTVDIEYKVEERASDQIELSGGWGAGTVIGTLGLTLNNFSARKVGDKKAWSPIPSGDGQRLSLRAQTNGTYYQSYNASFTEPWLGGKKPNSLSVSIYHSRQSNGYPSGDNRLAGLYTTGLVVGLGKRLHWPDDYFTLLYQASFQQYNHQYSALGQPYLANINQGISNNLSLKFVLSRNNLAINPIFPTSGSNISLSLQLSPPYSFFNDKDYSKVSAIETTRWLEFHKWKFDASWFTKIFGKEKALVLMTRVNYGLLGYYNQATGITPFERFWVGGAGLVGFNLDGRELIALRGYPDNSLTPIAYDAATGYLRQQGATIYNRYTMELRYPISLNPQATVFPLVFAEAGGAWLKFRDFNPFDVYRSYG
ncbi:MAG: outer membrane protein assembly factor BamA, partial [Bacteroidetes bacterium]|nr:outer membrane protein assembly factor BamA [Bacteroidota bacterium]